MHKLITITGQGGIGKTTATKCMALNWAEGSSKELDNFDFVFHITLKDVSHKKTLAEIIIEQHCFLFGNDVSPEEIKTIIKGHTNQKILFIIDGYDEYQPGTCPEFDNAVKKTYLRNCWMVLTSRETKEFIQIAEFLDAEAEITGFDIKSVREYITKYVGNDEKCDELLEIASASGIIRGDDYGILCVPFLLNMICVLFLRNISLPRTKTGIISAIVERCPGWEEIRKTGEKGLKNVEKTIQKLGKFVLEQLMKEDFNQQFSKVINYS